MSALAWLDSSRDEQRRIREIIGLFSESESRDELGIGQVRDAFSDTLFPGTSTLHTRARYMLFIPWCFQLAASAGGRRLGGIEEIAGTFQRQLILAMAASEDPDAQDGLIGRRRKAALKTLPSALYWSALGQYGIRLSERPQPSSVADDAAEIVERSLSMWHRELPDIPDGFPATCDRFHLASEEAGFLRERMLSGSRGSLLALLLNPDHRPAEDTEAPWTDVATEGAGIDVAAVLSHAEKFSFAMHGAALLYNLLIAERYEQQGLTQVPEPVERYRDLLAAWAETCSGQAAQLRAWDRDDMWARVRQANPRIGLPTVAFVDAWLDVCRALPANLPDQRSCRDLISGRERAKKGPQSRLTNDKLLAVWSGAAGSTRLTYRWRNVQTMVGDIHDGLSVA